MGSLASTGVRAAKNEGGSPESVWVSDLESRRKKSDARTSAMLRLSFDRGDEASMLGSSGAAKASRRESVARGLKVYVILCCVGII